MEPPPPTDAQPRSGEPAEPAPAARHTQPTWRPIPDPAWPPRPQDYQPLEAEPDAPTTRRQPSWVRRKLAHVGAAILAFLAKLKAILLFAGQFKLLVTAGSMAVSVAAYATLWPLPFAVGVVLLLLVHETGHVIALRREGVPASAPMFIPFLGAVITSRSLGEDAAAEARVGLAGPVLGSVGASVCLIIWQLSGDSFWQALGFTGLFINLFNLLPVVPLDGGRAMAAMAPWMWVVGLAAVIGLAIAFPNPLLVIIAVFAAIETWSRLRRRRAGGPANDAYYRVAPHERLLIGAVYLGLIVALGVGMHATHLHATL